MDSPVATALKAEAVVVLVILIGLSAYVNVDAIFAAIAGWRI